jgi:PKD domain
MNRLTACFIAASVLLLIDCHKNNAPGIPTLSGPSVGETNVAVSFTANATDADKDDICYKFSWGDGSSGNWSDAAPSGQSITVTHTYTTPMTYNVTVKAKDIKEVETDWSSPRSIVISSRPPNTPSVPVGPSVGDPNNPYTFSSSATDPDGDNIAIRFDWGDGDSSSWSSNVSSGTLVSLSHTYSYTGTYHVKAQAKDVYGNLSDWSGTSTIIISGWVTILNDDFENTFPGTNWELQGSPTWGVQSYRVFQGYKSCWCAGTGMIPPGPYAANMNANMVYGPFSLSDANDANITFEWWCKSENSYDWVSWFVSLDGTNWHGYSHSGDWTSWSDETFDLTNVPVLGNICGQPTVYFAFTFTSDNTRQYEGAYIDNVQIQKHLGAKSERIHVVPQNARPISWKGPLSEFHMPQKSER